MKAPIDFALKDCRFGKIENLKQLEQIAKHCNNLEQLGNFLGIVGDVCHLRCQNNVLFSRNSQQKSLRFTGKVIANIPRTTPDGSAEATVGGMDVLHALGFSEKDLLSSTFDLVMADKSTPLLVVGEKEVTANYEGISAKITITFSPDITGLLLSWYDCVSLGILHEDYPRPWRKQKTGTKINSVTSAARGEEPFVYTGFVPLNPSPDDIQRIGDDIANVFTAVFDQTGELNCMEGPDMIIELTDDAVPFYVNGSRPLPFADRPLVKQLLDK
ncbi:hypothetical protein DAPPUDRAFT_105619 [Daphnia pulex]|uniref:Uncharacterized protein n=1 Tax=Daphnia pulex TaxID=6669 RepID=E9GR98_DAPPU|nr:hypothetical protein DAPPUDRAFT_105619 [Daphnia pulex]|eukprot:EFX78031.1 hypothetical protein DAPPUDRAFT_105619 [Daphnia pulex]